MVVSMNTYAGIKATIISSILIRNKAVIGMSLRI